MGIISKIPDSGHVSRTTKTLEFSTYWNGESPHRYLGGHLKMYHPWPLQTVPVRARVIWEEGFLRTPLCLPFPCRDSRFMEPVALAAHLDEMAVMHESIKEGRNGGRVAKQFGPILERSI
jgi:hypothetical protein